jgi:hypothetical protein
MEPDLLKSSNKRTAQILMSQINGEIEYIEEYLSKLKMKVSELETIINEL